MRRYILGRLAQLALVLFGVTLGTFSLLHLVPGDPARTLLGVHATNREVAVLRHEWGLDRPVYIQYLGYLGRILHLNLGTSTQYQTPVSTLIGHALPVTLAMIAVGVRLRGAAGRPAGHTGRPPPRRPDRPARARRSAGRSGHAAVLDRLRPPAGAGPEMEALPDRRLRLHLYRARQLADPAGSDDRDRDGPDPGAEPASGTDRGSGQRLHHRGPRQGAAAGPRAGAARACATPRSQG